YIKIYNPDKEFDYSYPNLKKKEKSNSQDFYNKFWPEFLNELELDDKAQSFPKGGGIGNITFRMPHSDSWLTVYFDKSKDEVGVMLKVRGEISKPVYNQFLNEQDIINSALSKPEWLYEDNVLAIRSYKHFDIVHSDQYRGEIKDFLSTTINNYVNCFRTRINQIISKLK
ncbi:MAG: DUF4268 domain-containing protein, partial [Gammaproteobacteria bacterium]|nr:DUF4268 domain-containing protein [Gammaproteobacteria bacterium]